MLSVIVTLVLVAILIFGVAKRLNPGFLLLTLAVGSILVIQLVTGTSIMGEETSGNLLFDVFEFFKTTAASQLGRNVLIVMTVMGYVAYMEELKASTMFALYLAKPFQKLKNKYLLIPMVILLGALLKLGITSGSSLTAMLLATMYPVLRKAGLSRNSAAAPIAVCGLIIWGPADANWYLAFTLADITTITVPQFFVHYMIPVVAVMIAVLGTSMLFFSKYYDKKEGDLANENDIYKVEDVGTVDSLGIPKFYALFPLLPLIIILIWSGLLPLSSQISVVAAHIMCFMLVLIINMIVKKNFKDVFNQATTYFAGMGKYFNIGGIIMITASMFAAGLRAIGGFDVIGEMLTSGSSNIIFLMIAVSIMGFIIAASSHMTPAMTIFIPFFASIVAMTGTNVVYPLLALIYGASTGLAVYAVNSALIITSGSTGMPIASLLKRNLFPALITFVAVMITVFIMMAVGY